MRLKRSREKGEAEMIERRTNGQSECGLRGGEEAGTESC